MSFKGLSTTWLGKLFYYICIISIFPGESIPFDEQVPRVPSSGRGGVTPSAPFSDFWDFTGKKMPDIILLLSGVQERASTFLASKPIHLATYK